MNFYELGKQAAAGSVAGILAQGAMAGGFGQAAKHKAEDKSDPEAVSRAVQEGMGGNAGLTLGTLFGGTGAGLAGAGLGAVGGHFAGLQPEDARIAAILSGLSAASLGAYAGGKSGLNLGRLYGRGVDARNKPKKEEKSAGAAEIAAATVAPIAASMLVPAVGAGLGAITGKKGKRKERAFRGAASGVGLQAGAGFGAGVGGLAGAGLTPAAALLLNAIAGGAKLDTQQLTRLGMAGMGVGGTLGALRGGYKGYQYMQDEMGPSSYDKTKTNRDE